jgi:hypothetical protein
MIDEPYLSSDMILLSTGQKLPELEEWHGPMVMKTALPFACCRWARSPFCMDRLARRLPPTISLGCGHRKSVPIEDFLQTSNDTSHDVKVGLYRGNEELEIGLARA